MGGNVRVGLEDSIYIAKGVPAKSSAEQVRKIRRILEELSLEVATPAEAREMLQLKGPRSVDSDVSHDTTKSDPPARRGGASHGSIESGRTPHHEPSPNAASRDATLATATWKVKRHFCR